MCEKTKCVIVGGAPIDHYEYVRSFLREGDFVVCCDAGLRHEEPLGVQASLIVGDFDSHERPVTDREVIVLPHEKDDTDTFYAVKECLKRGFRDFLLLGMTGGRLDHTLGNLQALVMLDEAGVRACMVDDYSEISVVSGSGDIAWEECEKSTSRKMHEASKTVVSDGEYGTERTTVTGKPSEQRRAILNKAIVPDSYKYFSLLAIGGDAHGVSVTGAKYPLTDATLTGDFPLGVSNEVLPGEEAHITVERGRVLLMKVVRDVNDNYMPLYPAVYDDALVGS